MAVIPLWGEGGVELAQRSRLAADQADVAQTDFKERSDYEDMEGAVHGTAFSA
ncbi:hypothetical protein ACVIW2_000347 [Bradyrhizobium huanghuaihaiense]